MTWQAVARKDFRDSLRSRWLWALTALFVLVFSLPPLLVFYLEMGGGGGRGGGTTDAFLYLMKQGTATLVPLISIVIGYAAVTRERESGSLKLLLSLPHSRDDVVFGKVLGRSAVVGVSTLIGFVFAAVVLLLTSLEFAAVNYLLFALLTLLLGLVFVGLSVGISAAASTSRRSMVACVALYISFVVLWSALTNQIVTALTKRFNMEVAGQAKVYLFVTLLNPTTAYKTLVDTVLIEKQLDARLQLFNQFVRPAVAQAFGGSVPFYLSDVFVVAYLLFWLFVPVAIGILVFERADL
ncbi:ABC transporter permease subunit [Haladaptatus salinisoli]|uniref:ABC transporter permease subunit n=1 Tax=Haladaptatus salinisoli TaxID=2884876 RepID=UPI001D09DA97|nr:ABC transporter permease subunit [Haladaptatus salinisoli]